MKQWSTPDALVFGPERPYDETDEWDAYWGDRQGYERFVIDNESPDYAG